LYQSPTPSATSTITKITVVWAAAWIALSPTSAASSRMATISGSRAGEGETRASCSRRWLSSIMSAWVRRALRQMATRSARPATAMARNAAAKSRLMLGTGEGRSGAGWVMRPLQIGERAVAGQERRRSAGMLAGGWGAL